MDTTLSKKEQNILMFNRIAKTYDRLNHLFSFGMDRKWRGKAVDALQEKSPHTILDVATGTGDMLLELRRLNPGKMVGVDLSEHMLFLAERKLKRAGGAGTISLKKGDAETLPFSSHTFDAVTVAFGVRNYEHLPQGLKELHRVLKTGGRAAILELSLPKRFLLRQLYRLYLDHAMPFLGGILSKDKEAYHYLKSSVHEFPKPKELVKLFGEAGFGKVTSRPLAFGACTLYVADK